MAHRGTLHSMVATAPAAALVCMLTCLAPAAVQAQSCGNGSFDDGEACEFDRGGERLRGQDCTDHGFVSGTLRCTEVTCQYDTSGCSQDAGPLCGNGANESGEQCDGGCRCAGNCVTWDPDCGNQCLEGLEECDDGDANSQTVPDACRPNCNLAGCGDGVIDTGEYCDDGPANSDFVPDVCRGDCRRPWCGDGVVDVSNAEQCDRGVANSNAAGSPCSTMCLIPFCGNGQVEAGETCDDNNNASTDACTRLCRPNTCGDGFVRATVEACDTPSCGYACGTDASFCGNGALDDGEECDDGVDNADAPGTCRTDCSLPRCGDGVVDVGEVCDRSPGCLSDCTALP